MGKPGPASGFSHEQYDNAFPAGIEEHYWHRARNRVVARKLRPWVQSTHRVLDIGCGPGIVVDYLRGVGIDCYGADIGTPTPSSPGVARYLHLGTDAFELPEAFRDSVTVIVMVDVLEHMDAPDAFLRRCFQSFEKVKHIFVSVPARMEIWSNYDEYYGHLRRYSLETLAALARASGASAIESGYFFHALYAGARLVRLFTKERSTHVEAPRAGFAHKVLGTLLDWEERIVPRELPGSSVYAVLERA